jgi:hypothetical protein
MRDSAAGREMPWIRKQLGGDLRRGQRCKTHKRPVVKIKKVLKKKKEQENAK